MLARPRALQVISGDATSPFFVAEGAGKIYPNLFRLVPTDAVLADAALDLGLSLKFQGVTIITDKRDFWTTGVTDRLHAALQQDGNLFEIHYRHVSSVDDTRAAAHEIQAMPPTHVLHPNIQSLVIIFCV